MEASNRQHYTHGEGVGSKSMSSLLSQQPSLPANIIGDLRPDDVLWPAIDEKSNQITLPLNVSISFQICECVDFRIYTR
jgi:hypothetical protein